jgi:hypothetical protein
MASIPRELQVLFEDAIDRHGLANVLDAISEICAEKADHIRASYDDKVTARTWSSMADVIRKAETAACCASV